MKHIQKFLLVPIEKWEKVKRKGYEFKRNDSSSTNSESNESRNSEERGFSSDSEENSKDV